MNNYRYHKRGGRRANRARNRTKMHHDHVNTYRIALSYCTEALYSAAEAGDWQRADQLRNERISLTLRLKSLTVLAVESGVMSHADSELALSPVTGFESAEVF